MTNPIGNPPGAENSLASENEQLRKERDAAETRYVEAREEAASLEQQVADLQQELFLTKQKHAAKPVRKTNWTLFWLYVGVAMFWVATGVAAWLVFRNWS